MPEKQQEKIFERGSQDKADNVTKKLGGVEQDIAFIDGTKQYGKLQMNEHTNNLTIQLSFQGLEEVCLVGWTDETKALKKHEQQREGPYGRQEVFFAQSGAQFIISKLSQSTSIPL
jgi:hypothetical protein